MTSPLRRKRPTTVRERSTPTWKATRYAWPLAALAALAALLVAGAASAQQAPPPRPLPPDWPPASMPMPSRAPAALPTTASPLQPVAMQKETLPPPAGTTSSESAYYAERLELPGFERVFGVRESEESLKLRLINEWKGRPLGERQRIEFPVSPALTKGKYGGRVWPESQTLVEPNYVCYRRPYFEQKNFERYGWDLGPITPVVSTLTFWKDVALLPYHMGTDPFRNYECSAGYCMPGDPVPLLLYPPDFSATGALAELATIAALVAIFP